MKLRLGYNGWFPGTPETFDYNDDSISKIYDLVCGFYNYEEKQIGISFEEFKKQIVENGQICGTVYRQNAYIKGKWFWKKQVIEYDSYNWFVYKMVEDEDIKPKKSEKSEKEIIIDKLVENYRKKLEDILD